MPPIEATDLLEYLVLETTYYTKQQFKAFKSLEAYNQMVSGFVTSVMGRITSGKHVVVAEVRHFQRMNDPLVSIWIIAETDGTILSSHNDVEIIKETVGKIDKQGTLANLSDSDYQIILDAIGWLNCDIIQQAQVLLYNVNPSIEGFQRPTLGPVRNFYVVTSECIQILHTGSDHWVCVSSIGCSLDLQICMIVYTMM